MGGGRLRRRHPPASPNFTGVISTNLNNQSKDKKMHINDESTQNHVEEPYWVVMEPVDPTVPGMNHVLVSATSQGQAALKAHDLHGANGWRCLFGCKLEGLINLINRVQDDPRFCDGKILDWFFTVIADRDMKTREGVMIVAKNPRRALKAAWRDIRSKGGDKGRFAVVASFCSAHLGAAINSLLAEIQAQANSCN